MAGCATLIQEGQRAILTDTATAYHSDPRPPLCCCLPLQGDRLCTCRWVAQGRVNVWVERTSSKQRLFPVPFVRSGRPALQERGSSHAVLWVAHSTRLAPVIEFFPSNITKRCFVPVVVGSDRITKTEDCLLPLAFSQFSASAPGPRHSHCCLKTAVFLRTLMHVVSFARADVLLHLSADCIDV